ncbi:hypothetical protein PLICRDRAFT_80017, partial [Plicaturopsis crispa FD-325 SS-3]
LQKMQSSLALFPSTPTHRRPSYNGLSHQPLNSSPLASPKSSPTADAHARRRSQYKSRLPSTPASIAAPIFTSSSTRKRTGANSTPFTNEDPQKAFLRDRFKARCVERARNAREEKVRGKRSSGFDSSSDGFDMDMAGDEEEEDDEQIMQDELFRRIVENTTRKQRHSYRLSYADEVGSSIDPDIEDVSRWEAELRGTLHILIPVVTPEDLEDEELQMYAEEYAALADFEGIDPADFSLSDLE